jgi:hypothetical protein
VAGVRRPYPLAVLALVASFAAVLIAAGVAIAAPPAATVARELERSAVYVDPAYEDAIPTAQRARLRRAARAAPGAVRIALTPLVTGDQYDGDTRDFLTAVRSRLPADQRDGTFLTNDDGYLRSYVWRAGESVYDTPADNAEYLANFVDGQDGDSGDRSLGERVEVFLALLRRPATELASRAGAARKESEERARTSETGGSSSDDGDDGGIPVWVVPLVGLALAVAVVVLWRRSRRGARIARAPLPVLPDRVFEHARAAQRADLAEDAERELLALATVLDEAPVPRTGDAQDAYQRALDAYTGARRRLTADAPVVDLVGVLVLVDHARSDLARSAELDAGRKPSARPPLCFFDPLHGRAARTVAWGDDLRVPACAGCAAAVKAKRPPDALRDGGRPYFEADTVWARTGYGAFDDDLVGRIARGER